jgi:chromosome condensin MukBEF complex kleisin-like MukF subunit
LHAERHLLKELGFGFYGIMEHPHKYILNYIMEFESSNVALAQRAWNYLNDSLRLDLCLRYRSEVIAAAAIYMAARDLQVGRGVASIDLH